jgi:hypothetical protein
MQNIQEEIKQKQIELNELKLQATRAHFRILYNKLTTQEVYEIVHKLEAKMNTKFKIYKYKQLWLFKRAEAINFTGTTACWHLDISHRSLKYMSMEYFSDNEVMKEIQIIIDILKPYIKDDHIGVAECDDVRIPELSNCGIRVLYI